jgi:hypothetical protein
MKEGLYVPKPRTHLDSSIEGARPIFVCVVGEDNDFKNEDKDENFNRQMANEVNALKEKIARALKDPHVLNVNFLENHKVLNRKKIKNAGYQTYAISPIDSRDKVSVNHNVCIGLIVAGIKRNTRERVSFAGHQDPEGFLNGVKKKFLDDLGKKLREMKAMCVPGTIDAVAIGGVYIKAPQGFPRAAVHFQQNYLDAIQLLSHETKEILGFEPTAANGPKTYGGDSYLYENYTRRLNLLRPYVNPRAGDFPLSDFGDVKDGLE